MNGKLSHFTRGDKTMQSQLTGAIQLENKEGEKIFFLRSGI
jgi:hypothetical protein